MKVFELLKSIDAEKAQNVFDEAAKFLLNEAQISVGEIAYEIVEIEFYYYHPNHQDPYIHGHDKQKEMGHWYFHGAGVDITFGDEKTFGGILIRGIKRGEQFFSGPINSVDELLNQIGDVEKGVGLVLKEKLIKNRKPIKKSTRIGLENRKKAIEEKSFASWIGKENSFRHSSFLENTLRKNGYEFFGKEYRYVAYSDVLEHKFKDKTKIQRAESI